ncbi:MAG: alkaline phosphatase [Bradymonadaceae bacterium]
MSSRQSVVGIVFIVLIGLLGCSKPQVVADVETTREAPRIQPEIAEQERHLTAPRRIILFIGDGMGVSAVTAATYAKGMPLHMLTMPEVGFNTTHEYEFLTTDSAASATALATGFKTHFEGVSVKPGTTEADEEDSERHLTTIVEEARKRGWRTGLVATSRINHATPAAFAAHRAKRKSYEAIALDMSGYGVDVMMGGGSEFFESRTDGRDLFEEMKEEGYEIGRTAEEVRAQATSATKLLGLMHERDMPSAQSGERAMTLSEMVEHTLAVLDRDNDEGFVLMVEGSQIDWYGHELDGVGVVAETLDMDDAVGRALSYARQRQDTLVVVTADHETGGLDVLDPPSTNRFIRVLGGDGGARKLATGDPGKDAPTYAPPIEHIGLGTAKVQQITTAEAASNEYVFGPQEAEDRRFSTAFGYFSVASRPLWDYGNGNFSATHTAVIVPVFAEGPGSSYVAQAIDNADLGARLHRLVQAGGAEMSDQMKGFGSMERPKNVILLIGDGMGVAPVTAALYARGSLTMMNLPVKGLVATHGTDRIVNDSAATATALATGYRTRYGAVSMAPIDGELRSVPTVLERASAGGLRTGLVTTTTLTHATPAAFYGHQPSRNAEGAIALQFTDLPERIEGARLIDVAFAGGFDFFGNDGVEKIEAMGGVVEREWNSTPPPVGQPTMRLLAGKALPDATSRRAPDSPVPTLAVMTEAALQALASDDKGFFLMVEGGQIDWALHGLSRGQRLIDEVIDFDEAVAAAVEFAQRDGDTLVIVTADHDHTLSVLDNHYGFNKGRCGAAQACGGKMVFEGIPVAIDKIHGNEGFDDASLQGKFGTPQIYLQYSWIIMAANERTRMSGPHSANFVPLFALGPWANRVGGFRDQPEIGKILMEWATSAP